MIMIRQRVPFNLTVSPEFIKEVRSLIKKHNIKSASILFEFLYGEWKKKGYPGVKNIKKKACSEIGERNDR